MQMSTELAYEPAVSDEDFSLFLPLIEGPSRPMNRGLSDWVQMYRISKECGDKLQMAVGLQNVFNGLGSAGRPVEALLCARRLLSLAQEIGDRLLECHALNAVASSYWVIGDHAEAFNTAGNVLSLSLNLPPKPFLYPFTGPEAIRKQASELLLTIRQARGQLRRALADHNAMLAIHRESGDTVHVISSMESLGMVYKGLGEHAEAVNCFSKALEEVEVAEFSDPRARAIARAGLLGNLGVVLTASGNTSKALDCIQESQDIHAALSDNFGQIGVNGQKGRALLQAGRVGESIECFETMLRLARQHDALAWQQAGHYNLARALLAAGNWKTAALHCDLAAALAKQELGHVGTDLYYLRAALFHPQAPGKHSSSDSMRFIALSYYAFDELHKAVRKSRPSVVIAKWIDDLEDVILEALKLPATDLFCCPSIPPAPGESTADRSVFDRLETLIHQSAFVGRQPFEIALYCLESLRAQEFQEKLLLDTAELDQHHDDKLALELAQVEAELSKLQSLPPIVVTGKASFDENHRLVVTERESAESISRQEREQREHQQRVEELSAARSRLALQTVESEQHAPADIATPARLEEICSALHDDEMFIEFVLLGQGQRDRGVLNDVLVFPSRVYPDDAFAMVITRSWCDVVPLGRTSVIEPQCEKLLDLLQRFGSELSLDFFEEEAVQLFELTVKPILDRAGNRLDAVKHLVISSDGALNLLPFDLLVQQASEAESWRDLDYLARRFSTEYCPSATVFVDLRQGRYHRGEPGKLFVGFGDPAYRENDQASLPGTRRELESIASLLREKNATSADASVRVYFDADARKDLVCDQRLLQEAEYLHLACHGTAGQSPYHEGALFLASRDCKSAAESVLTTPEVMRLRTFAKLVVLSACETGLGKSARGEGIQGMARGWLFAGAQSVIATMWQVEDDPAAEIMKALYREAKDSSGATTDALALAKRQAISDERLACPAFWAAFVAFGGRSKAGGFRNRDNKTAQGSMGRRVVPESCPASRSLSMEERELLVMCGRSWETSWQGSSDEGFRIFFENAAKLRKSLDATPEVTFVYPSDAILQLVSKDCRIAWEYWAKEKKTHLAVSAYKAWLRWEPAGRSKEWDAVASAYHPDNLARVRKLAKMNRLRREFEIFIDASAENSTIKSSITWDGDESQDASKIEVVVPISDPACSSTAEPIAHNQSLLSLIFRLKPGERIVVTEPYPNRVLEVDKGTFIFGDTWGSSLIPHWVTIRFHSDFVPLSFQREQIGKSGSVAMVKFSENEAELFLRPHSGPWLERFAVMFRRAPGASAMLGAPGSPFKGELEFREFQNLIRMAQRHG